MAQYTFSESGFGSGVENGESTRSLEIHRDNCGTAEGRGRHVDGYSTFPCTELSERNVGNID